MNEPRESHGRVANAPRSTGWGFPRGASRWHWFTDNRSLCGSWRFVGHLYEDGPRRVSDCKACRAKLDRAVKAS